MFCLPAVSGEVSVGCQTWISTSTTPAALSAAAKTGAKRGGGELGEGERKKNTLPFYLLGAKEHSRFELNLVKARHLQSEGKRGFCARGTA